MKSYYLDELIYSIHSVLAICGYKFNPDVFEKYDSLIKDYILSNINCELKKSKLVHSYHNIVMSSREIRPIVLRYYALMNDSLHILDKLSSKDYDFDIGNYSYKLYGLDRDFFSKFNEEKFINLLLTQDEVMRKFYNSLRKLPKEEKDSCISDFAEILQTNPKITYDGKKNDSTLFDNLLNYNNLKYFGKNFIMKSTIQQRRVINSLGGFLSEDDYIKIKELLEKYPIIEPKIPLTSEVLNLFTFEELNNMSYKDANMYLCVYKTSFLSRVKEILDLDPTFDCEPYFLKPEILKSLDNSTIVALSDSAKKEISEIRIPYIDGVYVMPIRKINKIVIQDEKNRKKEERKNAQHR